MQDKIISMEYGLTSNSKSPMWRCTTQSGERVNVFDHDDPNKNNYIFFARAGYEEFMTDLRVGEKVTWNLHPIEVEIAKNGRWNEITNVSPRPDGAKPDSVFVPLHHLSKAAAIAWAANLLEHDGDVVIWDTETTGFSDDAEIVQISAINLDGRELLNQYIKPRRPELLTRKDRAGVSAADINGLTPERLEELDARPLEDVYHRLVDVLEGATWVLWNADFDVNMLKTNLLQVELSPIVPIGVSDAMRYFSTFYGHYDRVKKDYVWKKLTDAADHFELEFPLAHDALADCKMTLEVIAKMATSDYQLSLEEVS